jgi:hypothetical protein
MDDALKLCWDATVNRIGGGNKEDEKIRKWQKAQSNSKEFWRNYSKKKLMPKKSGVTTAKDFLPHSGEIRQTNT